MKKEIKIIAILFCLINLGFTKKNVDYVSINGTWVNSTRQAEKVDGKYIVREITIHFRGEGTLGGVERVAKEFNMPKADGKFRFYLSFEFEDEKYRYTTKKNIMTYNNKFCNLTSNGGFFYDDEAKALSLATGKVSKFNLSTNKMEEVSKDSKSYKQFNSTIKVIKLTEKKLILEWDINENGTIEADEKIKFESSEEEE